MGLPPVTATLAPKTQLPTSEASSTCTGASSAGWPARPSGVSAPKLRTVSSGLVAGMSGVLIGPGATLLTRMPFSPYICARLAQKLAIADLMAAQGASVGEGLSDWTDELPMIEDPGAILGTAALVRWNMADVGHEGVVPLSSVTFSSELRFAGVEHHLSTRVRR